MTEPQAQLSLVRWLRIGLLLFIALAFALGLQALLLVHKERELLVSITVSRIGIAADQVQAAFDRAAANGLQLAESRGLQRLLPRLQSDDQEIVAIRVFEVPGQRMLFTTAPDEADAATQDLLRRGKPGGFHLDEDQGRLSVARALSDPQGESVGTVVFSVQAQELQHRLAAANAAMGPRLLLILSGLAAALPLVMAIARRLGARRFSLRTRLLIAALILAGGGSLSLSLQALPSFTERLAPALDAKADALARFVAGRISTALALGIPFDKLRGVEDYFQEALARHPEILSLSLEGQGGHYSAGREGSAGSRIEVAVDGLDGHLVAHLHTRTDAEVVSRELRSLGVDLGIVFLVAVVLFNEALGAILAGDGLAGEGSRARLGMARLAVFLLILSEELTRAFLPLHITSLAQAAGQTGSMAVSLPISAYMASFAILTPFAGRWAERFGAARTFAFGSLLSAAGFTWAMLGGGYLAFIAARCLCAAGYAIGTMAMQQHFLRSAGANERTRALALFVGALQTAAICGSPVGGLLAERIGALAVFGAAAVMSALGLLVQYLDRSPPPGGSARPAEALLPVLKRRAVLLPLLTVAAPLKLALAGFLFYLMPLALQEEGYGSGSTGRAMMLYFLLVAAANPLASWLSDRFGWNRRLVSLGGLVISLIALGGWIGGLPGLAVGVVALGLGTGLATASLQAMLGKQGPAALILLRTVERLGAVIGPLLAGSLLTLLAYGGVMMAMGSLLLTVALMFALLNREKERPV